MSAAWESENKPNTETVDSSSGEKKPEENKCLVILKSNAQSMKTPETFLKNRNWQIHATHQLREALAFVIQKNPGYILIAADHPNKKVRRLPQLLAQAFQIKVIAYTENTSSQAMGLLHDMKQEYTLFPPVSGPAIERIILKIQKDIETQKSNPDANKARSGAGFGDGSSDETNVIQGGGFEAARKALSQLISSGDSDSDDSSSVITKGQTGNAFGRPSGASENSNNPSGIAYGGAMGLSTQDPKSPYFGQQGSDPNSPNYNPELDPSSPKYNPALGPNISEVPFDPNNPQLKDLSEEDLREAIKKNQAPGFSNRVNKDEDTVGIYTSKGTIKKSELEVQSIIIKGTHTALEETIKVKGSAQDVEHIQKIDKASNIACIVVESERFNGYLVAALGKNRKVDDHFIDMIRERLFSFLKTHGEVIKEDAEKMSLSIQEVEFEDWALEQAEFLKKSVHDGDEIAMAFFPTQDTKVKLEESVSEKMLQMTIDELREDTPVEFDLYIYMPENQKYLLYTPQGMTFYGKQKDRLNQKGVSHIHLRKENTGQVKKYRAQNFLNDKIATFQAAKKK